MPDTTDTVASTRAWVRSAGKGVPGFDNPAFDRMADVVFDAMTTIGGEGHLVERLMVLTKTTALALAAVLRGETDEKVEQQCEELGHVLAGEVFRVRHALRQDTKRRRARG